MAPRQRLSSSFLASRACLAPSLQAYLASETEGEESAEEERGAGEEEEDEEAIRARYRALLLGGGDAALERQGKKDWGGDESGSGSGSEDEAEEGSEGEQPNERGASKQLAGRTRVKDDKGAFPCGAVCWLLLCVASLPHFTA